MTLALLCSGQGRQHRTMFEHLADRPSVVLDAAATLLGRDLRRFVATASDTELHANRTGQILCVASALGTAEALFPEGAPPQTLVAGYSVGELAAWGVARVWSPAETLALVDARAAAMDAASDADDALGYIRGLAERDVAALATRFDCAIAIINPDRLLVVGGARRDVAALCDAARAHGALRAGPMPVHVASHTPRLAAAVAPFTAALAATTPARPALRLMTATDQSLVALPARAIAGLAAQIATTIDWAAVLDALAERGIRRVLELGPGSALAEMAQSVLPNGQVRSVADFRSLAGIREWVTG